MITATKINWADVTLYAEGESTNDRETVAKAMRQFRDEGCITGFFLDPEENRDGGPSRDEIDFSGLDTAGPLTLSYSILTERQGGTYDQGSSTTFGEEYGDTLYSVTVS